jgi:membrane-associated phospholipid phosphatase
MTLKIAEFDNALSRRIRLGGQDGLLHSTASILAHSGDSWLWLLALGAVYALGNAEWKHRALVLLAGTIATAAVVTILKYTIRRRRPLSGWGSLYRFTDPHSFPSGHAARGAALAVIALWLGPSWLGIALLVWTPILGLVRVMLGVHYLFDVLAGFAVGAFTASLVLFFV